MLCFFATSCINRTVGPSGIFSVASYHFVCCSAQKYGVLKTSWRHKTCTPCLAAWSISFIWCSRFSFLICSTGASTGAALCDWIKPPLTIRGICLSLLSRARVADHQHAVQDEPDGERDEPRVGVDRFEDVGHFDFSAG